MTVALKRVYEPPESRDGRRILVDRIWPRGLSKDDAGLDEWMKEVAPSDGLRTSFHKGQLSWKEFRNAYLAELKAQHDEPRRLAQLCKEGRVTLVYGAHDTEHNNAVVLMQYLKMLGARLSG